jgi:hypothetical protein
MSGFPHGDHDLLSFNLSDPEPHRPTTKEPALEARYQTEEEMYRFMIEFIVNNAASPEEGIRREWAHKNRVEDPLVLEAFAVLVKKFKKLRKTKEEMTKYCMRKAFKYLSEKMRNEGRMQRGDTEFNLSYYCE